MNINTKWIGRTLLGVALVAAGCDKEIKPAAGGGGMPPARVTAVAAVAQDVPVYLDEIGKIVATDVVSVVPQVGGKIIAAHLEDGAEVKKGQLLFEMDARPFDAALSSAKAAMEEAKADLATAASDFKRVQALDKSVISQQEFDDKKNLAAVNAAKVDARQADIDIAELNLEYTKIKSPIDGRAGAILVQPGNIVKANEVTLLVIQKLDPIYAEFSVTENDLGTVRKFLAGHGMQTISPEKGLKVEVDVPGNSRQIIEALGPVTPQAAPSTQPSAKPESEASAMPATMPTTQPSAKLAGPREGELTFLDNAVQDGSGTIRLRALLPNTDHYFWPGQFVGCRLILTVKKDAVLVPIEAQQIGQQGPFVYVVEPDGTAKIRPIHPGQRQGNMLVVDSGVAAGEKVIISGQMLVMPGAKVQLVDDQPKAMASAAN